MFGHPSRRAGVSFMCQSTNWRPPLPYSPLSLGRVGHLFCWPSVCRYRRPEAWPDQTVWERPEPHGLPCLPRIASRSRRLQVVSEPSLLASPYKSRPRPPPWSHRGEGEDMSSQDLHDTATSATECGADSTSAGADNGQVQQAENQARRGSGCSVHGHGSSQMAPTSVEDKCLECCVYYGVLCCQCTIL